MTWTVEFDDAAVKEFRKLDYQAQKEILSYLRKRIATDKDPRRFGKPLSKNLSGLWRYRIRDYRVVSIVAKVSAVETRKFQSIHRRGAENAKTREEKSGGIQIGWMMQSACELKTLRALCLCGENNQYTKHPNLGYHTPIITVRIYATINMQYRR